ncbi:DMT family transporter [Yoonia vestfoldensis]|uniref:DMT family transporter n=1 Tax=Yoonia vestfoldensis TaxID=245188 RepID=UPI0003A81A14|nr:DMT family transporter [Yoonia vestfoldensis]
MSTVAAKTVSPSRGLALIYLLFTGSMLGTSTILAKLSSNAGINPVAFLTWSILSAAALLFVTGTLRGVRFHLGDGRIGYFVVAGLVTVAAPNLIIFTAAPVVGAGFVALSIAFPPLLTYLGALLLRIERFDLVRAFGVALALFGAIWLALGKMDEADASLAWIGLTLLIPVFLAIGNIYRSLRWPAGAQPEELAPGMLAAAGGILLAVGLTTGQSLTIPAAPSAWLLLMVQSVTFTCQFFVFFMLQRVGGPVILSLLGAVAAIVTVPLSVVLLAEDIPAGLLIGGITIGLGIFCVTRKPATGKP